MNEKIDNTRIEFENDISKVDDSTTLEEVRIKYFSRNGIYAELFEEFKKLPKEKNQSLVKCLIMKKNQHKTNLMKLKQN